MSFNKICRVVDGAEFAISVQHYPDRKRPMLCVHIGNDDFKVGEITDEFLLASVANKIFFDAKVVNE